MSYISKTGNNRTKLRSCLSKLNFALGFNPEVEKVPDFRRFIPDPYKAVVLLQADFELAWAWRFSRRFTDTFAGGEKMGLHERDNVPKILSLCDEYDIPITWATVGHLFLDSCSKENGIAHPEIKRLSFFENKFWKFQEKDWFDHDPCTTVNKSPAWYCPDLIEEIVNTKTKHEIGCHTFSHIDCSDKVCAPEVIESELQACRDLAQKRGISMTSFVHPAHTIGNLASLAKFGYTNYRTNYRNILGYPVFHPEGIWELKSTTDFVLRPEWSAEYHVYRYCRIIERAIRNRSVCVFWFHPSLDLKLVNNVLPGVFAFLMNNKDLVKVYTSGEYVDFLNKNAN